jgi:hypothetical protein
MLFQNIVKRKKLGSRRMGGAGVGTAFPNRKCTPGVPHTAVLATLPATIWGTGGDALTLRRMFEHLTQMM